VNVASGFQAGALRAIPGLGNILCAMDAMQAFAEGDVLGGVMSALGAVTRRGACFSGEMLLDVEGGKKRADAIRVGDRLASRPEWEPEGALAYKEVKGVFERWAPLWEVEVGGQVLRTTGEHPFWVEGRRGWVSARELVVGDLLRTKEGRLVAVARVQDTGVWEKVYNWEVEDYHTYFVSATADGASVWAHNAECDADLNARTRRWREALEERYPGRVEYKEPGTRPVSSESSPGGVARGPSANQMNSEIQRGQAPRTVERVDTGKITGEQTHVHFDDGSALNFDGTWKHGPDRGGTHTISNAERDWLRRHGWPIIPG
jgi:hypothetical protein